MATNPLLEAYTLPPFSTIRPEHVAPAVREVLESNRATLNELLTRTGDDSASFDTDILPLEELADRLSRVWSPVSHLHAVMNSPELRTAYNQCLPELARYQTEIGQNEALFHLYDRIAEMMPRDREDASSLLQHALRDFRLSGVDLPNEQKSRFMAIMEELTQLQATFEQNVLDSMDAWTHLETDEANLDGLPGTLLEQARADAVSAGQDGWLFHLDQPTYVAIVTHAENRDLRYRFYKAWATRASEQFDQTSDDGKSFDNSEVIEKILALRHEAAGLIGFDHFAAYSLASKMAVSVDEIRDFLDDLANKSQAAAREELEDLEQFAGQALDAWDVAFYAERLRLERFSVSDEQLRPYFPLDTVVTGMFDVVNKLYGLSITVIDDVDTWHKDVRFYRLAGADGTAIGAFYCDLFARQNKRAGAWMDECLTRKRLDQELQLPIAHLVCNFAAPTASVPCLMTHNDIVTLFHEFGHTLHHVLTRINYPSVAGINGVPWDAVELPSQFMENYAWQPEVVQMISGHYETGEPLPEKLLDRLQASRVFHAGLQMVRQLEFSLFDLRLHAEFDPRRGSNLLGLLGEVREQVAVIRQPDFNRFPHSFAHVFGGGYAAGYYSYKWAEVLAADAWSAFEENGIFDPKTAKHFRTTILEIGGTRPIGDAFAAFRGRPPSIKPLLAQSGIESDGEAA